MSISCLGVGVESLMLSLYSLYIAKIKGATFLAHHMTIDLDLEGGGRGVNPRIMLIFQVIYSLDKPLRKVGMHMTKSLKVIHNIASHVKPW